MQGVGSSPGSLGFQFHTPNQATRSPLTGWRMWCLREAGLGGHVGGLGFIQGHWDFPGSSDGKESACKGGDPDSTPGSWRSPKKEMTSHSSILAWKIPGQRSLVGYRQRVGQDWVSNTLLLESMGNRAGQDLLAFWESLWLDMEQQTGSK